ncbi:MAG TPA: isochorismatase family protein, partial [Solirubrobacteraceae bacterium]|nr:isochorismatase family protein [Solirubrobacteraceae bacterium]
MSRTALIVVDMLNAYEHADADALTTSAAPAVPAIAALIRRAQEEGAPVIYVNDNFGAWTSDRRALIDTALAGRHRDLVKPIVPADNALF